MDTSRHDAGRSLYGRSKARLPPGPASWPTRWGTSPIMVLTARSGRWLLPTSWPAWPAYSSSRPDTWRVQVWTPPAALVCQSGGVEHHSREASMGQVSTIGLDLAKSVFQVHGADASGAVVFRKRLRRGQVRPFFAAQPPCAVALEACGSAHPLAREIGLLGHAVRLIPPAYVKPFVKRQKNNATDAEAICEAAQRPTMRFVAPKSEQTQAAALVFRARDLLVRQRTQVIN